MMGIYIHISIPSNPSFPSFLSKMSTIFSPIDDSIVWGDYQYDQDLKNGLIQLCAAAEPSTPALTEAKTEVIEPNWEADVLAGWTVPDLSSRRALWENFPIDVVPIFCENGVERHAIRWNEEKLANWRNSRAESWDEYQEYEAWSWFRLADAFASYPDKYTVETAHDGSICHIVMAAEQRIQRPSGPRALDILKKFPVSWDRDNKIHYIKLHRVNARAIGAKENDVAFDLAAALATAVDCKVTGPKAQGYMMTVTLL